MSLLLYWYGREGHDYYRFVVPFYFSSRQHDEQLRVIFPLGIWFHTAQSRLTLFGPWYARRRGDRSTHAFFPLYWRFRDPDRFTTVVLFPLFYDDRAEQTRTLISLPVWYFRRPESTTGVVPPWFWRRSGDYGTQVLFPIYWRFINPDGQTVVAPPFYALRSAEQQTVGFFPLFHRQSSPGSEFQFLFPLYAYSSDHPTRWRFLTLLVSRGRNGGERAGHLGLYYYRRSLGVVGGGARTGGLDERTDGVLPLFHWSRTPSGFTWWSGPWYWERDERYRRHWLFPAYFYEGEDEEHQLISLLAWYKRDGPDRQGLLPLYYWSRSPEARRDVWFPLVWRFQDLEEHRTTTVIPPLAWFTSGPDSATRVINPLFYQFRRGPLRLTIIPPLMDLRSGDHHTFSAFFLWWRNRTTSHSVTALWPVFGLSQRENYQHFLSPIVWYRRNGDTRRGIVPPYYWRRGTDGQDDVVFPLLWRFDRNTRRLLVIPPAYRYARPGLSRLGLFPLYHRGDTASSTERIALPWYWYTRTTHGTLEDIHQWYPFLLSGSRRSSDQGKFTSASGRVLLVYGWERYPSGWSHDLFPLYAYRHRQQESRFMAPTLLPLVYYQRRTDLLRCFVFPYYHQRSDNSQIDIAFPLYWRWGDGSERTTVIPPVYRATSPDGSTTVVFPLAWHRRHADAVTSAVVPLWYYRRDPQAAARTLITPLYWSFQEGESAWGWGGCYVWFRSPDERTNVLFPVYLNTQSPEGRLRVIFPLWWDRVKVAGVERVYRVSAAIPLYYRWVSPNRTISLVFPLYWHSRSPISTLTIVPPIYTASSEEEGELMQTVGVMPLFSHTKRGTTYRYVQILGRLFAYQRVGDRIRYTYLFVFHTR
ncbi:MAG: hypothetical protein HYZ73_06320 [Elusimicrobia bacterium]|nr:hypothetical protein [Elusimicrobiota bacterium]